MPKPFSFSVADEKQFRSILEALAESMRAAGATEKLATKAAQAIGQQVCIYAEESTLARRSDDTEQLIATRKHLDSLEANLIGAVAAWSKLSASQRDALTWAIRERLCERPHANESRRAVQLPALLGALKNLVPALSAEISSLPKGTRSRKRYGGAHELCFSAIWRWRECTGKLPAKSRDGKTNVLHQHLRNLLRAASGDEQLRIYIRASEFNSAIDRLKA